jgi:hypothetical protein
LLGAVLLIAPTTGSTQSPALTDILARAAQAVAQGPGAERTVTCEERSEQWFWQRVYLYAAERVDPVPLAIRARIVSVAVTWPPADGPAPRLWRESSRLVSNGPMKPAGPNRADRLLARAEELATEFELRGDLPRLATIVLHADIQPSVEFTDRGDVNVAGTRSREVRFTTTRRPPTPELAGAEGTFWIDPETGRVLKSVLKVGNPPATDELTVTYGLDPSTGLWLPTTMRRRTSGTGTGDEAWMEAKGTFASCRVSGP